MMNIIKPGSGTPVYKPQQRSSNQKNRTILIISMVIVMLFVTLWIWKTIQINSIKKDAKNAREELRSNALQTLTAANLAHLKTLIKPYAWAIRTELMQGNINQVNQYANEMIKETGFQSIVVANEKGIIISSTNKKFEGKDFSMAGKRDYLTTDSVVVDKINEKLVTVSSPVMGFNSRLGTLLITYQTSTPKFLEGPQP